MLDAEDIALLALGIHTAVLALYVLIVYVAVRVRRCECGAVVD